MFELGTDGPSVIVVGVDGSEPSLRAAAYAAGLARRQRARLTVVYIRPLGASLNPMAGAALAQTGHDIAADLVSQIRHNAHRIAQGDLPRLDFIVESGDPFHGLVAVADRLRADVVVIGGSSRAGHRIAGSVAVRLVKAGRWPVTVVP
jgi:nucleotide-binding universal stress UspA family protein